MRRQLIAALLVLPLSAGSAFAVTAPGNAAAGRQLVMNSCAVCHTPYGTTRASDQAPPLSVLAKDNKADTRWIHGWLMDPHPPMPGIMLSRKQVDDVIAFLATLPVD